MVDPLRRKWRKLPLRSRVAWLTSVAVALAVAQAEREKDGLIAALKHIPADHADKIRCIGIDIDESVCNIALLNMLFFNANAFIIHGNALDQSAWHIYGATRGVIGGKIEEYTDPEDKDLIRLLCFSKTRRSNEENVV